MQAPISADVFAEVFSFLNRDQIEQNMMVCRQLNSLIQQRFSETPYRKQDDLELFLFEQNMEVRLKPDSTQDQEYYLDVDFESDNTITHVFNGLLGKSTTRVLNTRLFYDANSLQAVDQILEITNAIRHLWSQQSLALIFNDIDFESAIYAGEPFLFQLLTYLQDPASSDGTEAQQNKNAASCKHLELGLGGTAMRFQTDWFPLIRQFEAITLCVTEGTLEMTQLAEYLHSSGTEEQSIYVFVCNNATEGSFDACETEFDEFLEVIKMKFQEDTTASSYAITFDFLEVMEMRPFVIFNSTTSERLQMTYEKVKNEGFQQSRHSISRCFQSEMPSHLQGKRIGSGGGNTNTVKKRMRKANE